MTIHSALGTLSQTNRLSRKRFQSQLASVEVELDGPEPYDRQIIDERAINRIMQRGLSA